MDCEFSCPNHGVTPVRDTVVKVVSGEANMKDSRSREQDEDMPRVGVGRDSWADELPRHQRRRIRSQ